MRYTYVKQHDATDCAAACLAIVCLHYKKETTITKLRDMMGTDLKGTNLLGLDKCAAALGFITQAVRVDREGFLSKYTLPAIANVITKEGMITLPMQYYTFLEEAGNGLSGGEKQRIALARAFLKKNEFYILDESTSNLDFATEIIIFDMIYNKLRKKSMLIVAHRLATVKNCDEIIVMDEGSIVEQGSHEELLARKGKYYELWEMQQGNFRVRDEEEEIPLIQNDFIVDENELSYT